MARERDDYSRLLMELDADIESLRRVRKTKRRALDRITAGAVDELDYARPIDPVRVMVVQEQVDLATSGFVRAHERFRATLEEIRDRVNGEPPSP